MSLFQTSCVTNSIELSWFVHIFSDKDQTPTFSKLSWFWLHSTLRSFADLCFSMRWMNGWLQQRSPHREPFILILGTSWNLIGESPWAKIQWLHSPILAVKSPSLQILRTVSWSSTLDFWRRTEEMPANSWNRPPIRALKERVMRCIAYDSMTWLILGFINSHHWCLKLQKRWAGGIAVCWKASWRVNRNPLQLPIKSYQIYPRSIQEFCCVYDSRIEA